MTHDMRAARVIALAALALVGFFVALWLMKGPVIPCPVTPLAAPPRIVTRTVVVTHTVTLPAPPPVVDVTIYKGSACIVLDGHKIDPRRGYDCRLPGWPDPLTRGANGKMYDKD